MDKAPVMVVNHSIITIIDTWDRLVDLVANTAQAGSTVKMDNTSLDDNLCATRITNSSNVVTQCSKSIPTINSIIKIITITRECRSTSRSSNHKKSSTMKLGSIVKSIKFFSNCAKASVRR